MKLFGLIFGSPLRFFLLLHAYIRCIRMLLKQISILNYKNLAEAELAFSRKVNCFVGHNGMGKTNLLDTIYYLSFCKSATNPVDSQNIRHGTDFFMLQGHYLLDNGEEEDICCSLRRGRGKKFRKGKKDYRRLSDHIGSFPLVQVSPADGVLVSGGSEERRRFMDMTICQYDRTYLDALVRYNKALMQRNALLKMAETQAVDETLFSLWEGTMDEAARVVFGKRQEFVDVFVPIFNKVHAFITSSKESVSLAYTSHLQRGPLLGQLLDCREKEKVVGYTLHGVHKDDLEMLLGDFPLRREGSQGQGKSYLVALKLGQYLFLRQRLQVVPLLLLDDFFDKLDNERVKQIIRLVSGEEFGQIFLTDTHREHLSQILSEMRTPYRIFSVEKGRVKVEAESDKSASEN